ncbi:MAG: transglutaminase-like domain-containing protein [Chloroflexi bacterium]|nr:transglutaminase-like domain-containing protein [Chloroflexota bacterium]
MSTATDFLKTVPGPSALHDSRRSQGWLDSIGDSLGRFAPIYDWVSLLVLTWMMVNVGWAVQLSGWGDLPSIIPALLLGTIAAFVVSKLNFHWVLTIVYATGLGFIVVLWRGGVQAAGGDPVTRAINSVERFVDWINIAQTGGISTDTVPFAIMFMAASWVVGYGVTALTFRFRSPWLPTVLLSLVILTNLSYRHGQFEYTFFLFLVGGIVLFAHLTTVRRIERWRSEGIEYSRFLSWVTVQDGLLFAFPIVLLSAMLPVWEPRSETIHNTWDIFRAPFQALREPANRLLAGVHGPGGDELLGVPSQTMAFGGSLELTEEPLMWVRSKYVVPYAGRVYQEYTSEGWLTASSSKVKAAPRTALTLAPTELERERVSQVYVPLVATRAVLPAGGVFSSDRETEVQILNPVRWRVPLTGTVRPLSEMPPDLRDLAFTVRFAIGDLKPVSLTNQPTRLNNQLLAPTELVEEVIRNLRIASETGEEQVVNLSVTGSDGIEEKFETRLFPLQTGDQRIDWDELEITVETDSRTGMATALEIERAGPIEQVGVELVSKISRQDTFSIQSFVSLATNDQLNAAGTNYPTWVTDRYLQLPASLPNQVRDLASQIVREAGATTPFEKAEAIKNFLTNQEYSLEISGPEFGVDGIYYFLFQTQSEPCASDDEDCDLSKIKGYSQYFGSSAAVLLRAVGVPARFVAGWAPGEFVPDAGLFLIRDNDRHGWSQVYFPGYGWIEYEVTPGSAPIGRGSLAPTIDGGDILAIGAIGSAEEDPLFLQDIANLERLARELRLANAETARLSSAVQPDRFEFPWRPFAWAGGVVASGLLVALAWWFSLRGMDPPTKAYARMNRVAWLTGMRRQANQTAMEFALNLGIRTYAAHEHASFIAIEFQRCVYAKSPEYSEETSRLLDSAWRKVARALIAHRFRQLGRLGPELGEGRGT